MCSLLLPFRLLLHCSSNILADLDGANNENCPHTLAHTQTKHYKGALTSQQRDSQQTPPCRYPSQCFYITLQLTLNQHSNLIIQFLNLILHRPLLCPRLHLSLVKHSRQFVLERGNFFGVPCIDVVEFRLRLG